MDKNTQRIISECHKKGIIIYAVPASGQAGYKSPECYIEIKTNKAQKRYKDLHDQNNIHKEIIKLYVSMYNKF